MTRPKAPAKQLADEPVRVIGERLHEARVLRKLRQIDVAFVAGMDTAQISRLELNKGPDIQVTTLGRLCRTLDVSADYLLGLSDQRPRAK